MTLPAGSFGRGRDLLRSFQPQRDALPALVVFVVVGGLALENGGFFPRAWTAAAVALLWVAALTLLLAARVALTALEGAWLALLGGFLAWTALSEVWSLNHAESLLELRRGLIYLAGLLAILLLATRRSVADLVIGVWASVTAVVLYALVRYLFESKVHSDEYQATLLFRPLGYANGLGIFAGLGAILALALALRASRRLQRTLAAASIAPLVASVQLTGSRASALAVCVGLVVMLVVERDRVPLLGALLVVGPIAAAVVALSADSRLTEQTNVGAPAERQAHFLVLWIVLAAVALAVARPVVQRAGPALARRSFLRRGVPVAAGVAAVTFVAALVASGWAKTFFATGARPTYWRVAWHEYLSHPWLGSGAGTFGDYWTRYGDPALEGGALDAHNLYLETLAEVGPVGLVLLVAILALPLIVAFTARAHPFVPAATGAYVAFLAHAALDWDWELPAVTLAGLMCAAAIMVAWRDRARPWVLSARVRGVLLIATLGLAIFAVAAQLLHGGGGGRFP